MGTGCLFQLLSWFHFLRIFPDFNTVECHKNNVDIGLYTSIRFTNGKNGLHSFSNLVRSLLLMAISVCVLCVNKSFLLNTSKNKDC